MTIGRWFLLGIFESMDDARKECEKARAHGAIQAEFRLGWTPDSDGIYLVWVLKETALALEGK